MSLCGDGDLGHRRLGVLYLTDSATHRCNVAKAKPKKPTRDVPAKSDEPIDPKKVHELFGIVGPYDPPAPPIPTTGYVRWWDCGMSVQTLVKKQPSLFYIPELFDGERCAKDSDSWRWRMWGEPIEPNLQFADQEKKLKTGDQPAAAREVVMYLALVFLTTGEKLDLGRLRTKDRAEMGTLRGRNGHQPQERGSAPHLRAFGKKVTRSRTGRESGPFPADSGAEAVLLGEEEAAPAQAPGRGRAHAQPTRPRRSKAAGADRRRVPRVPRPDPREEGLRPYRGCARPG